MYYNVCRLCSYDSCMGSVKRKPIYCGACSCDLSNAVRIRCAQLAPAPSTSASATAGLEGEASKSKLDDGGDLDGEAGKPSEKSHDTSNAAAAASSIETATKKHDNLDVVPTGPRSDGLVQVCDDFDVCGTCFIEGKEVGRHKRWHDYRVVTQHAYPIFTDDWGADEELLLISACQTFGLGNWADIAEHIGSSRTKEEVESHYLATYVESPDYPLPNTDVKLIDQDTFQARKRQRLEEAQQRPLPLPPPKPLASAPTSHEIAGYMPGRLEFETEWENDAEVLIKDMEFGLVLRYGGESQPTREEALASNNSSEAAAVKVAEDTNAAADVRQPQASAPSGRGLGGEAASSATTSGVATAAQTGAKGQDSSANGVVGAEGEKSEDVHHVWTETDDDLELKLTIMEIYNEKIDRRHAAKALIFARGLLDYKKILAVEKKRPKEEKDILNRLKVFSRLQTAQDHEQFANGLLYEQLLRKHIQDLQEYRQAGLTSFHEVDKYEKDKAARIASRGASNYREAMMLSRSAFSRTASVASSREGTPSLTLSAPVPGPSGGKTGSSGLNSNNHLSPSDAGKASTAPPRKLAQQQLTFSNSASLHLLTAEEAEFCSAMRILPKPFLFIKQALLREFARLGGKLERSEALALLPKLDQEVVTRVWEEIFGVQERQQQAADDEDQDDDEEEEDEGDEDASSSEDEGSLMQELQALQSQGQDLQSSQQNGTSHTQSGLDSTEVIMLET